MFASYPSKTCRMQRQYTIISKLKELREAARNIPFIDSKLDLSGRTDPPTEESKSSLPANPKS
jgi:hypothetical protein